MSNFDLRKFLAEGRLLNEEATEFSPPGTPADIKTNDPKEALKFFEGQYNALSERMADIMKRQGYKTYPSTAAFTNELSDYMDMYYNAIQYTKKFIKDNNLQESNTMKKSELREMIAEIIKEVINESNTSNKITEAYVPSNIKDFAKRKGVSSLVNTVAGWAEKVGKRITGGTAIGKDYSTLILDMGYQTGDIYIDTEEGTIELYGEPVGNFKEFKDVFSSQQAGETNESVDYDTAVAYRLTVKGDRDAAMANVKALLDNLTTGKSKKFPEVKVTLLPSKGNPNDLILKLNGPGAFSMSKDIKSRPELKGVKISKYTPQLTKIS